MCGRGEQKGRNPNCRLSYISSCSRHSVAFSTLASILIPSLCPYCASCIASVSLLMLTIHVTVYLYMLVLSTDAIVLHIVL